MPFQFRRAISPIFPFAADYAESVSLDSPQKPI
jgi:hypothetical protein